MVRGLTPSRWLITAALAALLLPASGARTLADPVPAAPVAGTASAEPGFGVAAVRVDGRTLFRVHGAPSITAEARARDISGRITAAAADTSVSPDSLTIVDNPSGPQIVVEEHPLVTITVADARLERLTGEQLARQCVDRIRTAMLSYRTDRSPQKLVRAALGAIAVSAVLVAAIAVLLWARRRLSKFVQGTLQRRISTLKRADVQLEQRRRVEGAVENLLSLVEWLVGLVLIVIYLERVLGLFPWTRELAANLLGYIVSPLRTLGQGLVASLPDLMFLGVLAVVVRLILRLLAFVAEGLQREVLTIRGFDPDWAWPTYRIARTVVLLFAVVVAYPFIPGSNTEAFKGVSLFVGLLVSLGSTSVIGNLLSGYTMIYRRAFRVGDRVLIDNQFGEVMEIRVTVTHLRSPKNEEIILPNSLIMSSKVTNLSALARKQGLILHTNVGIGYETPWRQVEAMLKLAADRTPGLLKDPPPFVLQRGLGDFAIDYELNVYTSDPTRILPTYTELHRNVLDVFNEYNVQIMTPAYETDPASAKVVPKARWYESPAPPVSPAAPGTSP